MGYKELSYNKLKKTYNPEHFQYSKIGNLDMDLDIIGQERVVRSMEFGLKVRNPKYNIFVMGNVGTGRKTYVKKIVENYAKTENVADDWCYVYNFEDPFSPMSISMPPGMGNMFKDDMKELLEDIIEKVNRAFSKGEYEKEKTEIIKVYQNKGDSLMEYLKEYCLENGFLLKNSTKGFTLRPLVDGKPIDDEEYEKLEDEKKKQIERKAVEVELEAIECVKKIKVLENEAKDKIMELDDEIVKSIVSPLINHMKDKYNEYDKIEKYLGLVQVDISKNIYEFDGGEQEEDIVNQINILKRYEVNVCVDNSKEIGAPVVVVENPNYSNLVGKIEYENEQGTLKTDFTMIKAGDIHRANGGYLILQANDLLSNVQSWNTIKRVLKTKKLTIESLKNQLGLFDIVSLKPEDIKMDLKIIIIGSPYVYYLLYNYDEEFEKYFKIKVDFDLNMDANLGNQMRMAKFIYEYCEKTNLKKINNRGVAKILEYSHKITGNQKKLTTEFDKLMELIIEASAWAEYEGEKHISSKHVEKAFKEKSYRNGKIEERANEMYTLGRILIDIRGKKIGKINGLSVIDLGDHSFGKPSVITVTTYSGSCGVINIEREADMSGNIHNKGIMILEGYLNEKFGKYDPLEVTAKVCFEQNYGGIDGDSASSTELYGILSSLGKVPLKQSIAVTGSINQRGEIQPVGGVTQKIEGFFSLCKEHGLTGEHGVIIPEQNIIDLVLDDEVIRAVKDGLFHIYPIKTIEEGMEILTDLSFEQIVKEVKSNLINYKRRKKSNRVGNR
ncbi:MAG: AAA family ATPase [Anaeromicrobium sp.]|jgi:lon-related putative ATP-dependent protease|uniref:Lon protease family protein n=1 Tax=Anaeromicrobium sp. TaxID=1929132 RepID=UPI0025E39FDB|nr:ATP-binding protein [Anaeromicrobium sp.]MCT4593007.1 AAA family ATPase [Anaeromicrobium sp.]